MNIRPETQVDHASIAVVVEQAFGQANEAQLIEFSCFTVGEYHYPVEETASAVPFGSGPVY
ncbi:hypothetical protein [Stenomitos frigidus]|uniref:Uncharacterized protein n=1 Tax=Stenomitos frigidus ULC18 TaxID=2107698 RepID=A0A2T1DT20_9CYAN|nr:hypothetical protein [Stenomitos frigidus]PSB23638.1 hypothetical protein C7B82_30670 [Stenomitos frigidus ULC18]